MKRRPGDHQRMFGRQVAADLEAFLEVAVRGLLGRVQVLAAQREVAPVAGRLCDVDALLDLEWLGEEPPGLREGPGDQRVRHAVVHDIEEPDMAAGPADLFGHRLTLVRTAG